MAEARQGYLSCSHTTAGFRLAFKDENLPPGIGKNDAGCQSVMTGTDDDDIVSQGVILPPLT